MHHYGGLTAKRHLAFSNAETVGRLDRGQLSRKAQRTLAASKAKSARTYTSKSGRKSFCGTKHLKSTGTGCPSGLLNRVFNRSLEHVPHFNHVCVRTYPPGFGRWLCKLHPRFLSERAVNPEIDERVSMQSLRSFFARLAWDDLWEDAGMISCLSYLRGSKSLHIGDWRELFPKEF